MAILENLYCGNIEFDTARYEQDSSFVKAARIKQESMEKLFATLNDTEKELFDSYCDAAGDIEGITRYDTYERALKFGILLMAELFMNERQE